MDNAPQKTAVLDIWYSGFLKVKDVAIAVLAVSYIFGQLMWQFYAWRHKFGFVSAINLQYLTSGLIFLFYVSAFVILVACFVFMFEKLREIAQRVVKKALQKVPLRLRRLVDPIRITIYGLLVVVAIAIPIVVCVIAFRSNLWSGWLYSLVGLYIFSLAWFTTALSLVNPGYDIRAWKTLIRKHLAWTVLISMAVSLVLYNVCVYPTIPQELGGGEPRLCYLDLEKDKVSDYIIGDLAPDLTEEKAPSKDDYQNARLKATRVMGLPTSIDENGKSTNNQNNNVAASRALDKELKVLHTRQLQLWYDSGDFMIVQPPGRPSDGHVVRIPKDLFMAVTIHDVEDCATKKALNKPCQQSNKDGSQQNDSRGS